MGIHEDACEKLKDEQRYEKEQASQAMRTYVGGSASNKSTREPSAGCEHDYVCSKCGKRK